MKLEKSVIAAITALIVIVGVTTGLYINEILKKPEVEKGDFVEINYIGYFENDTVFDTSINENITITPETDFKEEYNMTPLKAYIGEGTPTKYPEGWKKGGYSIIEGLWKGLIGMEEDDEKIIGPIPPKEGYGLLLEEGINFTTNILTTPGTELKVTILNMTNDILNLTWIPNKEEKFTMPFYWGPYPHGIEIKYPYQLWENATEVVSFNDTTVFVKTTPNKLDNLTLYPPEYFGEIFENKTTATYNEATISLTTTPEIGLNFNYYGYTITVENVTPEKINISIMYGDNITYSEMNRTETFNRSTELSRIFKGVPINYLEKDLKEAGYSSHELAGKTLFFKVQIVAIHKV